MSEAEMASMDEFPPQGVFQKCAGELVAWRAEYDVIRVEELANGWKRLVMKIADGGAAAELSPDMAAHIAGLLLPQGAP